MIKLQTTLSLLALFLFLSSSKPPVSIKLEYPAGLAPVQYAVDKINDMQVRKHVVISAENPDISIKAVVDTINFSAESYKIINLQKTVEVRGGGAVGIMYGLLEVKRQLESGKRSITNHSGTAKLDFRAIKFNLPWDSYRRSPALQLHQETCRDINFWESFLDMMAENRFNKLTLWNLHPFSYMVKTAKYPEACSLTDSELADWKIFWTKLFKMAKDRGIETYLVNWNIFVSPEFAKAHDVCQYCVTGKHFIPQGDTSEIIKDYTREAVRETIDTYPDLTGLGITLGEGMGGMTAEAREQWLIDSFVQGMREASRKVKFIHRVPLSAGSGSGGSTSVTVEKMTRNTLDSLSCVASPINIELKFNWSHSFSTPHLVKVHGGELSDGYWNPVSDKYKLAWMLRNEDFFMLRWGQPDFIRKHIALNTPTYVNGYYVGSEAYIPAKDYITALPGSTYKYAFDRQWMFYKSLGRLLYDATTPDQFFVSEFEKRFPSLGKKLFNAQTEVSKVPLIIASYQNASWDFSLYTEGMLSIAPEKKKVSIKLISLEEMADKDPTDPNYISISDFLNLKEIVPTGKISPLQLADSLDILCQKALSSLKNVRSRASIDLRYEIADIQTWANLGHYFATKLRAAVSYKRYKLSKKTTDIEEAITQLTKANLYWSKVVLITKPIYNPVPLVHFSDNLGEDQTFHWSKIEVQVNNELAWLEKMRADQ